MRIGTISCLVRRSRAFGDARDYVTFVHIFHHWQFFSLCLWRCRKAVRYWFSCRWKQQKSVRSTAGKAARVGLLQAEQPKVNVVLQARQQGVG